MTTIVADVKDADTETDQTLLLNDIRQWAQPRLYAPQIRPLSRLSLHGVMTIE